MPNKLNIEFQQSKTPITEPETKFGGQPVWLEQPEWPLSKELGIPMRFICQIKLSNDLFPNSEGKVAYIFMTEDEDEYVDGTWEPDSGENAVIIQPGGKHANKCEAIKEGPTLQAMAEDDDYEDAEYMAVLSMAEDPEFLPENKLWDLTEEESDKYRDTTEGNKIGGVPNFIQGDEFPEDGNWKLLLQLDSCNAPFEINFGDGGVAYAFINESVTEGKFLWQCG